MRLPTLALAALPFLGGSAAIPAPGEGAREDPASRAGSPAGAMDLHQLFTEANRLFNSGRTEAELRRAVEDYRSILERGIRNGSIYYNLGCTHLRLLEYGPAILNLRRALLYTPESSRIQAMLSYARGKVGQKFSRSESLKALQVVFFWHYGTTFEERLWTGIIAHGALWVLIFTRLFTRIPFHRTAMGILLAIALSAFGSAALEALSRHGQDAVVVLPQVEVRTGNGPGFPLAFAEPVTSGVEVRIIDARGNWKQIEFPNETQGWVIGSAVEAVESGLHL